MLSVQVLLGYTMLGALITRLSILFTNGGPAEKMTLTVSCRQAYWKMVRDDLKKIPSWLKKVLWWQWAVVVAAFFVGLLAAWALNYYPYFYY